jgi:cysteine desulfuration protein SufE
MAPLRARRSKGTRDGVGLQAPCKPGIGRRGSRTCHLIARNSEQRTLHEIMNCGELDELGSSNVVETISSYPKRLQMIVDLFQSLPEEERRETLISYAEQAPKWRRRDGESFDLEDIRKDEECTDTVGVFLRVEEGDRAVFRIDLGPQVQTLTRAMTAILCRGLERATVGEVLDMPSDFVPKIIGAELVRARSHTVYYVLSRMKGIVTVFLNRRRAAS